MKRRIFAKLFGMTVGLVLVIFIIQFIFQYFYLEDFYIYNKKKSGNHTLSQLKEKIEKKELNNDSIEEEIKKISIKDHLFIVILNSYSTLEYGVLDEEKSWIKIIDRDQQVYTIYIQEYMANKDFISRLETHKTINISGVLEHDGFNVIYPDKIDLDDIDFLSSKDEDDKGIEVYQPNDNTFESFMDNEMINKRENIDIKGYIFDININNTENYGIEYQKKLLKDEILSFVKQNKNIQSFFPDNKRIEYIKTDDFTKTQNMFFLHPLRVEDNNPMVIFAISSLQPMEETTEIMRDFFIIILLIATLLAIISSYFYSKKITRPLVHLNNVTKNMSELDFTKKCQVKTNDEIEDLADNINVVSEKLETTLNELKESNIKLKEDILLKDQMDEFRKTFIAHASHELKTPLTVMKGIYEGIIDGVYDYHNNEYQQTVLNQINDMSKLVHDLLQITKLESGEEIFKKDVFQLSDVVLKISNKLRSLINNKKIKVQLNLLDDFVLGDENKIERVIQNLYYNAVQYTQDEGEIIIWMKCNQDNSYLIIENKPSHIPEKDLPKIWEPFYRVEKSGNKALGGSGLGLFMVKEILNKHDSNYFIENTQAGVKVEFSLERIDAENQW